MLAFLLAAVTACDLLAENSSSGGDAAGESGSRGVEVVEEFIGSVDFGEFHALVIGINEYDNWSDLKYAEQDAEDIQKILIENYSFPRENVTFLRGEEATRDGILSALRLKLVALEETDNLLIYFAGHGQLDTITEKGYWIPREGGYLEAHTWISFSTVQDLMLAPGVRAKSVIIVTDSCYAGSLVKRSGPTPGNLGPDELGHKRYQERLAELSNKRSRLVIASGGFEAVPDKSDFAAELKRALVNNPYTHIDMELLFYTEIFPRIKFIGQQDPSFSRLVTGPDDDGQFVLVKNTASRTVVPVDDLEIDPEPKPDSPEPEPSSQKVALTVRSNVLDDTVFIDGQQMGSTRLDVELEPGRYEIRVEKEGYSSYETSIEIAAGDTPIVRAQLEPDHAPLPVIEFYEVKPSDIDPGETATLTWRTANAAEVNIDSIGDLALSGSVSVRPVKTQTYKVTAKNSDGMAVITEATVFVRADSAPLIDDFSADPASVERGRATVLRWRTSNADRVEIRGIGTVRNSGLRRVKPAETQSYTLVAKNKQGQSVEKIVTVKVKQVDVVVKPEAAITLPRPKLVTRGNKSSYTQAGKRWIRYSFGIANWNAYPVELFKPAPDLPPCGSNDKASRSWVDIYDVASNKRLYGYCAIKSPEDLQSLSFAVPRGVRPPARVQVVILDRKTGRKYASNAVSPR